MPYICLARTDIPDGVVQVLDLEPNASLRHPAYDPPAQTRYVNRVQDALASVQADGSLAEAQVNGLRAYLLDRVEPGGVEVATGTVSCVGVQAGDTVTLKGVVFSFVAQANNGTANDNDMAAGGQVGSLANPYIVGIGADNTASGVNLQAAIDDDTVTNTIRAAAPAEQLNVMLLAADALGVVTLSAQWSDQANGANPTNQVGPKGSVTVASSVQARLTLDAATLAVGRLPRVNETWQTAGAATAATALINAINNGTALTLAAVNTALTNVGGELAPAVTEAGLAGNVAAVAALATTVTHAAANAAAINKYAGWTMLITGGTGAGQARMVASSAVDTDGGATASVVLTMRRLWDTAPDATSTFSLYQNTVGSRSHGVLTELLSIMAGRGFRVQRANAAGTVLPYMENGANFEWNASNLGSFTTANTVQDTQMVLGEIGPAVIGGDTRNDEIKGITHTYDGDALQVSAATGHLASMATVAGQPALTLFPDSDVVPHFPWTYQGALTFPQVADARVLTIYNDDGTVLA